MMTLREYIDNHILPLYDGFDKAHQREHALTVLHESMRLAERYDVVLDMVYAIAIYHDTGLHVGRKTHHLESGRIVREDKALRQWFSEEQIEIMAEAVEDHRASADHEPRSIYGRIVAEADRNIDIHTIIARTVQYGLAHYPELDRTGHIQRALEHIDAKYSRHGYLKLWIPGSKNEARLHQLWDLIDDRQRLIALIEQHLSDNT